MTKIFAFVNNLVWGIPALVLILGVGVYLTVRLDAVQLRLFKQAMKQFLPNFGLELPEKTVFPPFRRCVPPWRPLWARAIWLGWRGLSA